MYKLFLFAILLTSSLFAGINSTNSTKQDSKISFIEQSKELDTLNNKTLLEELTSFTKQRLPIGINNFSSVVNVSHTNSEINYFVIINTDNFKKYIESKINKPVLSLPKPFLDQYIQTLYKDYRYNLCTNKQFRYIINRGISYTYDYKFENNKDLVNFTINQKDCEQIK